MAIVNPEQSSIYPIESTMKHSNITVEYDNENDEYYAEHEFSYPAKKVRFNIDIENSEWPTDDPNLMTITIPSNPQTDSNNIWDDTTKILTLTNLDENTLVTNNQNDVNYATDLNINLSNYQPTPSSTKINISSVIFSNSEQNLLTNMNVNSSSTITVNVRNSALIIEEDSTKYIIKYISNNTAAAISVSTVSQSKYLIINSITYNLSFYDPDNNNIITMYENYSDNKLTQLDLNKSKFNLIF